MSSQHRTYATARSQLISFLQAQGYRTHPLEVFCPSEEHCWVDVGALKGQDYWAFEYKSRSDSMRRGLEQCCCYARGFNYVVLVADRYRITSSPYFGEFRAQGFGMWRHDSFGFHAILQPKRRTAVRKINAIVQRQFRHLGRDIDQNRDTPLSRWLPKPERPQMQPHDCEPESLSHPIIEAPNPG